MGSYLCLLHIQIHKQFALVEQLPLNTYMQVKRFVKKL